MKDSGAALFNKDWKFILGDIKNAQDINLNDRTWKRVDLPHDWVIEQPFYRGEEGGYTGRNMQGFFVWEGVCWYRKEFTLDAIESSCVFIYFGGAYRNSAVFINGKEAGGRANGYISFELDITSLVKEGDNLIAVRLDNGCEEPDRWYSGSGLYRNVYLKIMPKTHIKTWGIQADSILLDDKKSAEITVTTKIISKEKKESGKVFVRILSQDGKCQAEAEESYKDVGKEETSVKHILSIKNPSLWSAENPYLYKAAVSIDEGQTVEVNFGIRVIEIAYNRGMTVNGEKVKLKGVCLHHDAGITGSAYYDEVWQRRLLTLKSIGCNAIRTSHNPPAEEFLDLCDELGFYVIDECFDKWKSGYYARHFESDSQKDLTDFILRDRNHPCIFMWSVGNEVEKQGDDGMIEIQKNLAGIVRALDSRPVTCALAPHANPRSLVWAPVEDLVKLTKKMAKDVDVLGLNYHEPLYEAYTKEIEKPIVGTECYEFYSCSGTNFEDVTVKNPWQFVLENDNVIGQFIWAGIDYLGEASWPAKGWSGSILDICAFMKPNAFFRKSIWSDEPFVYLAFYDQHKESDYARGRWSFPYMSSHLNHDHFHRRMVKAAVFTNCDEAELWINSRKIERRKREDFPNGIIEWDFEYAKGTVEVKGFKKGSSREECSYILKTAETAQKIKLVCDKTELKPGGIAHIEVNITDKNGILCQTEDHLLSFSLTGDGCILGACSSDLNRNTGFTKPLVVSANARALVMVKAGDSEGTLKFQAFSEKLEKAELLINVHA